MMIKEPEIDDSVSEYFDEVFNVYNVLEVEVIFMKTATCCTKYEFFSGALAKVL